MKFNEFFGTLQRIHALPATQRREPVVMISVHALGTIGPSPAVEVKGVFSGFDWDAGRVIIHAEQALTPLTPEQVNEISESVHKGQSWHAYEAHKKHRAEKQELIAQRDELLAALVSLAAVARRYLPDYDEHPEVQKADEAIARAQGGAA